MANNRLYIEDTTDGAQFMLAKGWGSGWDVWDRPNAEERIEALCEWLEGRDTGSASGHGKSKLRIVTENDEYEDSK